MGDSYIAAVKDWPDYEDGSVAHRKVGSYPPNAFGLHEMHGNVGEWCGDGYSHNAYRLERGLDPLAPTGLSDSRVYRGGSFQRTGASARSSGRFPSPPSYAAADVGVRPARAVSR